MRYNIIVGARPNFIKLWAFMNEAKKHPEHDFRIIHTGQHYDYAMSEVFFEDMNIPKPDIFLRHDNLSSLVASLRPYLWSGKTIVFGDTRSGLAGALAAPRGQVIHIEAGLRSHDDRMPEETNRIVIDKLSDLLFTTEPVANENLRREGFDADGVKYVYVGNLMIETLSNFMPKIVTAEKGTHILATIHRVENHGNLKKILELFRELGNVMLILHPGTRVKIEEQGLSLDGITVVSPQGYIHFMRLVWSSCGVITDSGGLQEETSALRIPCATLRDNTERPSTLEGSNKLFSVDKFHVDEIRRHLSLSGFNYETDFPDHNVAERIFKHL